MASRRRCSKSSGGHTRGMRIFWLCHPPAAARPWRCFSRCCWSFCLRITRAGQYLPLCAYALRGLRHVPAPRTAATSCRCAGQYLPLRAHALRGLRHVPAPRTAATSCRCAGQYLPLRAHALRGLRHVLAFRLCTYRR